MPTDERNPPQQETAGDNPYTSPTSQVDDPAHATAVQPSVDSRPRTIHVLLWLGCSAVAFAHEWYHDQQTSRRMYEAMGEEFVQQITLTDLAMPVLHALLAGVATACALLMLARWFRRIPFPNEPGEWLLAAGGIWKWGDLGLYFGFQFAPSRWHGVLEWGVLANWLLCIGFLTAGGFYMWKSRSWSILLFAVAVLSGVRYVESVIASRFLFDVGQRDLDSTMLAMDIAKIQTFVLAFVVLATFLTALVLDIRRRTPRSWIHWVAIGRVAAVVALGLTRVSPWRFVDFPW